MKLRLIYLLLFVCSFQCWADGLIANAPSQVTKGENFRLTYTISSQDVGELHIGNLPNGLELITGPYRSSQSSYQVINGHASSSSSTTFTFILCAVKDGSYKIPSASITASGRKYVSRPLSVKVLGGSSNNRSSYDNGQQGVRPTGSTIKNSDLFIKVSANKNKVYEQEPIVLTYKVYTLLALNELNGKMPDLTGFHTLEVPMPRQKSFHMESLNGKPYKCITWSQYIVYPQKSGNLEIPSIEFKGTVVQQNQNVDPFEELFNGGSGYVEVKRSIMAPGLKLNVLSLPQRPSDFSGGVGHFTISSQLLTKEAKSNEPVTIRVVISGNGNMKLIKSPDFQLPKDFDKYDPKVTDNTKITGNGLEGNMVYDYIVVPRNHGKYTIPSVKFVYFDTQSKEYKTIETNPIKLNVAQGDSDSGSVSDYSSDLKNKDIIGLKVGEYSVQDASDMFYGSFGYWIVVVLIVLSLAIYSIIVNNQNQLNKRRHGSGKRANKIAITRLSKANEYKLNGDISKFYDEMLKAMWGYVEEKFAIPSSELGREKLQSILKDYNISQDIIDSYLRVIDTCEFAHYSPSTASTDTTKIFEQAMGIITKIDEMLKTTKKKRFFRFLSVVFMVMFFVSASAVTKNDADNAYNNGDFQLAIKHYNALLKEGESAELYYNLGNSYYRTHDIASAVVAYERAHILAPSDDDINFNLKLANSKTIDKINNEPDMILVRWCVSFANMFGPDGWAVVAVLSLFLMAVFFIMYLRLNSIVLRKTSFGISLFLLIFFVLCNACASWQRSNMLNRNSGIVRSTSVQLKKVPDNKSDNVATIHEGTKVFIIDSTMKDWINIRLGDNREGWIRPSDIEMI